MRVTSAIADIDFSVQHITRQGAYLVVRNGNQDELPAAVYVSARDVTSAFKALFASPGALLFLLSAPFRRRGAGNFVVEPLAREDVNNPWL